MLPAVQQHPLTRDFYVFRPMNERIFCSLLDLARV